MNEFETVIGLEVHVQLKTESKIFCSCSTKFGAPANTNICPVCCGYPGVLPVFNLKVLELATRVCLALDCRVNENIYFERKSYFYPDLPKNYQISQYKMPLGESGSLELISGKKIRVNRVHMEEDAGKLIHKDDCSLVDFNRTGTPLLEIVSEPDISSPQEASVYLNSLKLILQYVEASSCDMEKGSLRCDANISLRKKGQTKLGTKVELKNMNTFKGIKAALEFEIRRQATALKRGQKIVQETRLWDEEKVKTLTMRSKEEAHDYRYFSEPDLLDFSLSQSIIKQQTKALGELPLAKRKRFIDKYPITAGEIDILIGQPYLAKFFEETIKIYPQAKEVSNWILGPFLEQVNNLEGGLEAVKISVANFAKVVKYFVEGRMNNLAAKKALALSLSTDEDIDAIMEREKLVQVSDKDQLKDFVEEVIKENPNPVEEYLSGKVQAIQFLVGQVMRKSKGKANPKVAKELLERRIKK
jgi:aspartyl-tRNA(Asn)/glutamyl-tRNA(Gln) amidotransferase subunit B